jgi:hypothetical protein
MADLSVTSTTYGAALTKQSDDMLAAVSSLTTASTNDAGKILTVVIRTGANINAIQSGAAKEDKTYDVLKNV